MLRRTDQTNTVEQFGKGLASAQVRENTITSFSILTSILNLNSNANKIKIRVRDEFRLTLHAAETLYESSIAFGNR